jgi:hypothetical protein
MCRCPRQRKSKIGTDSGNLPRLLPIEHRTVTRSLRNGIEASYDRPGSMSEGSLSDLRVRGYGGRLASWRRRPLHWCKQAAIPVGFRSRAPSDSREGARAPQQGIRALDRTGHRRIRRADPAHLGGGPHRGASAGRPVRTVCLEQQGAGDDRIWPLAGARSAVRNRGAWRDLCRGFAPRPRTRRCSRTTRPCVAEVHGSRTHP